MATTVTNVIYNSTFKGSVNKTNTLGSSTTYPISLSSDVQYDAASFTKIFVSGGRTGSETFDASASLTDPCGTANTIATMKFIYVKNLHASNALTLNASGSNLLGATNISIPAGQAWFMPCSLTVDGTHKNLVFGSGTYDLFLGGI